LIRALLLDFDGLILDTEKSCFEAWQQLYATYDQTYALEDFLVIVGTTNDAHDPLTLLSQRIGCPLDREASHARLRELQATRNHTLAPMPGVVALLDQAQQLGLRLAVASSSSHDWVESHLRRLDLRHRFEYLVNRVGSLRAKPEPDIYLQALRLLGLDAREALAIEASHNGSLAALRAGLRCLVVPNSITRSQDFSHTTLRRDSLAGLDLAEFLGSLSR